jgi:carbon starvation protein
VSVVNALYKHPWGTFTVGLTIPIAIFIGIYLKWLRPGRIGEASIIGVALIIMAVLLGPVVQHSALASYFTFNKQQLSIIIVVYGFLGAVLPTWLLLVPRDYLSTYMKIGTMVMLAAGVILVNPVLKMPQTTVFINGGGPVIPGKVWPFIFVTVACGAISGWHALVSSGTTPKMVDSEADIKPIGYGAMLVEGFVAVMALIAATVLSPADYFAINSVPEVFARLGMHVQDLPELSRQIGENLAGRPGGAVTLAVGMASIFSSIGGLKHLMGYWYHFAIMFEALFILTLIDAGTRIGRYLLQAMGSHVYQPLRNNRWWPGVIASSAVFSLAWGYLLYGGDITTIWPLFGVNNQLLACMALAIGTTIIIKTERVKYVWVTLLPLLFLSVTAVDAAYQNIVINYLPKHDMVSAVISVVMLVLVVLVIIDAIRNWVKILTTRVNMNSTKDNQAL